MAQKEKDMLSELETMDPELVGGQMVQAEDDAAPAAPAPAKVETPAPAVEPTPDVKQPPESYLQEPETVQEDRQPTRVPVSELQKERKRRQEAERQLAEMKAQKEQEPAPVDVAADLASLGDEEFIDKKTVLPLVQKVKEATKREVMAEIQQQRAADTEAQQRADASSRIRASEDSARKQFADYDATVQAAIKAGGFTPDEIAAIRRSANPGAVLYRKAKEVTTMLGITVQQPKQNQTPPPANPNPEGEGQEPESEDNIYERVFGKKKTG